MRWIVLAIVVFIPVYTWLTLHYRKPGPAYQPYQDMRDRADVIRLLKAGYRRVPLEAARPVEPVHESAQSSSGPGGLPRDLKTTLIESPLLPLEINSVSAAPTTSSAFDYEIGLNYTLQDNKRQLSGAHLYEKPGEIVIVPDFERIGGTLLARTREGTALLTVPPGSLTAGRYRVTVVGERASRTWSLEVR